MKTTLSLLLLVAAASAQSFGLDQLLPGFRPTKYTSLDLSQVDFENVRGPGHAQYISVPGDDASDEAERYRLAGVAPASAVRGGAAVTYAANIGPTVGVYREHDDYRRPRVGSQRPRWVQVEATLYRGRFVVLLDD